MNALEKWRTAQDTPVRGAGGPFAEYDLLGRKQPRRFGNHDYLLMIARIEPARVRRVPAAAIDEEGIDEEGEFALLECPCGARPVVRPKLERCQCERYFVLIAAGSIWVTYGETKPPPLS
jgi:hypothetical protein